MEEAPQGTFQDELDWCIQQLETGLLRRHPTQQQAQDTQRILRVLRSQKAPFVKKRQVMNQVFGNYRLKMSEERQQTEKAASPLVQIQEVTHPDSRSVAYRKCPRDGQSSSTHWFTPSNNSFNFNFCPEPADELKGPEAVNTEDNTQDSQAKSEQEVSSEVSKLCAGEGSGFTFNFQISEDAASSSPDCEGDVSTASTSGDQPSTNHSLSAVRSVGESLEATSQNVSSLEDACSTSGLSANQNLTLVPAEQNLADSPKKKKKKKTPKKSKCVQSEKTAEEHKADTEKLPPAKEDDQPGANDLQRELDWCVEQLEIGLQRQKSTSKQGLDDVGAVDQGGEQRLQPEGVVEQPDKNDQLTHAVQGQLHSTVEEAMRAIKTLRSEKVALVKKRQVMRTMFGDYRRKMEEERQKQLKLMQAAAKSARVIEVSHTARRKSSKVFRKCTHQSHSDSGQDLPDDSPDSPAQPAPNQGGFVFKASQEPFCFNFL